MFSLSDKKGVHLRGQQCPICNWTLNLLSLAEFRYVCAVYVRVYSSRYECLLQWQQSRSKAMMWLLYKNSSYSRVPKTLLLDWQLYFACYYTTTPTDYPSTTRGMSVGPPVAVNIKFCVCTAFESQYTHNTTFIDNGHYNSIQFH